MLQLLWCSVLSDHSTLQSHWDSLNSQFILFFRQMVRILILRVVSQGTEIRRMRHFWVHGITKLRKSYKKQQDNGAEYKIVQNKMSID